MTPEERKAIVVAFYTQLFNDRRPREAVEAYVGETYVQHNPATPDGREAVVDFATEWAERYPDLRLDIRRVIAEGDLVVTHSRLRFMVDGVDTAVADFWRLDDEGRIVEHWDVIQEVPAAAANPNTMF
jgi:predicted SnoaL-like aldol condensation-catalyzing enzyme